MKVLSLFDGISCGRVALERAGIEVDRYYASEIDKYAIQVSNKNYPDIIQVGDITRLKGEDFKDIDLIIGGSPCQGFSFAGKQLNFEDPRSKLFFEFVRLVKEIQPKYFLLENVKMKKEYQNVISEQLGVTPIEINSALVSAQNRRRLYWTNIPVDKPEDLNILLNNILEDNVDEKYYLSDKQKSMMKCFGAKYSFGGKIDNIKSSPVLASYGKVSGNSGKILINNRVRCYTPIECERLQTLPDNYTAGVSDTQRYKCLGNGWTVDVIAHILKNIIN